jgi:hypothetical protein
MGRVVAAIAALAILGVACDKDENQFPDIVTVESSETARLAGFWTGVAEVSGPLDPTANAGTRGERGTTFVVALRLDPSGGFMLWSPDYPAVGVPEGDRVCSGVYEREGSTITFFPSGACRALPLLRFTVGHLGANELYLEARSGQVLQPGSLDSAGIWVRIRVERD